MASPELDNAALDGPVAHAPADIVPEAGSAALETPKGVDQAGMNGSAAGTKMELAVPATPTKPQVKHEPVATPRLKKKVPWKGSKNIMVSLPRDDARGQPGKAPLPLTHADIAGMLKSWEELGYNIDGFDLNDPVGYTPLPRENYSLSRDAWPSFEDMEKERAQRRFNVTLPDLNAWKKYVDELTEAKLRALGVSLGDEDPAPPPSISPATSAMSRQASTQYPAHPFSPPIPTSSASSAHAPQQFPFPIQSPGITSMASPVSFNGKLNPRQSISISPGEHPFPFPLPQQQPSPHGIPPHLLQQGLHRHGSPSLANLSSIMSPTSPFSPDVYQPMNMHQRHQSMQYPMMPQHLQHSARASPRLQDLREVEEEAQSKSPSKTPEPTKFIHHNASASLQKEIDEAEYHLEEQFRSQFEHDKDYSPPNETELPGEQQAQAHARESSVQFATQPPQFEGSKAEGLVLHHPQPHSRGHSLSQKYFVDQDEVRDSTDEGSLNRSRPSQDNGSAKTDDDIETNPSNLGTPILTSGPFGKLPHQRSFSTASNPWSDAGSAAGAQRRPSHGSKPSLSKLNVEAPEFKFNPAGSSAFKPTQFVFSNNTSQPSVFQAGFAAPNPPLSANSSQFSIPSTTASKINAAAPSFSPGQSEFSFSASVPKIRPDAPAFVPFHSVSDSVNTPNISGNESGGTRGGSIFGNIDLSLPDIVKPPKKSKAIEIVRPSSRHSPPRAEAVEEDKDGRITDESRVKRFRGSNAHDDAVPLFAEPTPEPFIGVEPAVAAAEEDVAVDDKPAEDDAPHLDTALSSTIVSESTDTKDTTSPSEISPNQSAMNWAPFELKTDAEIQDFNIARPFGEDNFKPRHKKTLSATAKPFMPGMSFGTSSSDGRDDLAGGDDIRETIEQGNTESVTEPMESIETTEPDRSEPSPTPKPTAPGLSPSRLGASPPPAPPAPASRGLAASRFAAVTPSPPPKAPSRFSASPPAVSEDEQLSQRQSEDEQLVSPLEVETQDYVEEAAAQPGSPPAAGTISDDEREPTFEEIDAIMQHMNEQDPTMGVNKIVESPRWRQPSPAKHISLAAVTNESPLRLPPQNIFRSDAPSPSPRQYRALPGEVLPPVLTTELEDPFVDPPHSPHRGNTSESLPASDWEGAFSDEEQVKLDSRANFFDARVNEVVGGLLAARLDPLEHTLSSIQNVLASMSGRTHSTRRERRSTSGELQMSDADDEDDEMPIPRRSMSPRRDRKMEQIRVAVLDALAAQQRIQPVAAPAPESESKDSLVSILKSVEEMKEQFGQSLHLDFRGEDLRNIVEEAVERRMPPTPQPVIVPGQEDLSEKYNELQARFAELEQRLRLEESNSEKEIVQRRTAEDKAAEFERKLELAETRIEVEIMNRSAYDQRVADLEDRLKHQEEKTDAEVSVRRAAEDRLSEVQRLLRISSEEESRLREALEEKEQKIKAMDETRGKSSLRLSLLETANANAQKNQSDLQNRVNVTEVDLRDVRQEARHWRTEAEHAIDLSRRQGDDLAQALDENRQLHKLIDTLQVQLKENERVRETWRSKVGSLQDDMAHAAREIAEENARRTKREQAMLARQEVLDAKLQAESKTRERLETEIERLESIERQGMRAVSESKRLEGLLLELRTENHKLQQASLRYQAEFEEARESGAREVQRTRESLQAELEDANHQVNVVREELEDQMSRLRAQLDQVKLDADTAKARHDMLLEEAQNTKKAELEELTRKHQNDLEDQQARYERQLSNTSEDAQRAEQNLLERLSISTSKSEHLQERVAHLEERLHIAQEAAKAAAQAAKAVAPAAPVVEAALQPAATVQAKVAKAMELPEKISPQALRESIMVLQEQLQEREQRIEELDQTLAKVDPDAETKIIKRDDEIIWLRELLAVRHSDLQDIIAALSGEDYDKDAVKDAAIRLKANLQMEEQERERAMNGGSAINLPNIAATIRDAATPRVAQAVGPLAAAWGNWRKSGNQNAFGSLSSVLSSPAPANSTPRRESPASQSSFLSGLLTPPASGLRQTPPSAQGQPTAFSSTGRRFTAQDLANRPRGPSMTPRQSDKNAARDTPPRRQSRGQPVTPPMMRSSAYDSDAHAEDFDDAGFFDD
ncbi:Myosin class II heavy chain [Pleurostoma richardsiae]|uniref:Myosin class II heavy chain n=1 Tax=Pleurostoma richardsiae TaxID=41990 RepID=A0AA38SBB8_9PEZI|nr:Myosin class II heavy chain [Pleurostoma richardsiae]